MAFARSESQACAVASCRGGLRRVQSLRRVPRPGTRGMVRLAPRAGDAGGRREERARQLRQREVQLRGRHLDVLQARREILRQDRRARRQARRLRDQVHLRRHAAAAIPDRVSRRQAAGAFDRLGRAAEGAGRTALVSPLSQGAHHSQGPAALDQAPAELELHVRRLPLDQPEEELRRGGGYVQDRLVRDQRRLRGLPRARLEPSSVGGEEGRLEALRRAGQGIRVRLRRAQGRRMDDERGKRRTRAAAAARTTAKEVEACARCHARRAQISEDYAPGRAPGDGYLVSLLDERTLLGRRADARRGLQPRFVCAEQDVRARRDLQRLPRSPLAEAQGAWQRGLRAVPPPGAL